MDEKYLSQIENEYMKERILRKENISAIEYILNRDSQQFERLKQVKVKNKLDFGKKIKNKELSAFSLEICSEVDYFLGISSEEIPKIEYFKLFRLNFFNFILLSSYGESSLMIANSLTSLLINKNLQGLILLAIGSGSFIATNLLHNSKKQSRYYPESEKINLKKIKRNVLIPTLGHEYVHHIQNINGLRGENYSIFEEGHSRGVEKHLAKVYKEKEDNEAFIFNSLDKLVGESKSVYIWMCEKFNKSVNKNLLKSKSSRDYCEKVFRRFKKIPTPHAIGNSLFSIYEENSGEEIYKNMIHGNFNFY